VYLPQLSASPEPIPYNAQMRAFIDELRRRKVIRVGIAYLVVAWVVLQLADVIFPAMRLPDWTISLILGILVVGFPLALVLSWVFDIRATGIEKTASMVPPDSPVVDITKAIDNKPSVAVLPFVDMSPDHDNEYFADGLTEELISVLSQAGGMRVASRTSSFALKGKNADIKTVSAKLNVAHIVEGSVRKSGKLLRITGQLIEAANDSHLWSSNYDRELDDIFAIQDEIASQIARALQVQLAPRQLERPATEDVRAYDFYLRGNSYFRNLGTKNTRRAIEMYEKAIEIDPAYGRAWAGIAISNASLALLFMVDGEVRTAAIEAANAAAERATELEPESAISHLANGMALIADGRPEEAESEFATAIKFDPQMHEAYYHFARAAYIQGRMDKAAELFEQAIEVDPEDYRSSTLLIAVYRNLGQPEKQEATTRRGVALVEKHLEKHPNDADALALGAGALREIGNEEKAERWAERAIAVDPDNEGILYNIACYYSQAGKLDRAMDLIECCIHSTSWIKQDSDLDPLREMPRFKNFVKSLE
jgi:adenylate cyclase